MNAKKKRDLWLKMTRGSKFIPIISPKKILWPYVDPSTTKLEKYFISCVEKIKNILKMIRSLKTCYVHVHEEKLSFTRESVPFNGQYFNNIHCLRKQIFNSSYLDAWMIARTIFKAQANGSARRSELWKCTELTKMRNFLKSQAIIIRK